MKAKLIIHILMIAIFLIFGISSLITGANHSALLLMAALYAGGNLYVFNKIYK